MAITPIVSIAYTLINFLVDLSYSLLDPPVKLSWAPKPPLSAITGTLRCPVSKPFVSPGLRGRPFWR